jgi:hypothetical protein
VYTFWRICKVGIAKKCVYPENGSSYQQKRIQSKRSRGLHWFAFYTHGFPIHPKEDEKGEKTRQPVCNTLNYKQIAGFFS